MEGVVEKMVFIVGYIVVILVFFVGNILFISMVKRNNWFYIIIYCLIINLVVVDILVIFCNMLGRLVRYIIGWYYWFDGILGIIVCKVVSFIFDLMVFCFILILMVIVFECFCFVIFFFRKIVIIKIVKFMVVVIWLVFFFFVFLFLYVMSVREINGVIYCYEDWLFLFY